MANDKDLNDLLSQRQREDFIVLVADATDRQRKTLERLFSRQTETEQKLVEATDELSIEDDVKQETRPAGWSDELREPCLAGFDEWRAALLQRIGEVVNTKQRPTEQPPAGADDAAQETDLDEQQVTFPEPIDTPLSTLSREYKTLLLNALLLLLLSLEQYTPKSRTLLKTVASSLKVSPSVFFDVETQVAAQLQKAAALSHDAEAHKKSESSSKWKIGLASVAGAALVGITGGLAAPLVAAGLGSVLGGIGLGGTVAAGYLGAMAGSSVLVGGLFGAYGAKMAGETMRKYAAEVEDFCFVPLGNPEKLSDAKQRDEMHHLAVTIGISGWLEDEAEVTRAWQVFSSETSDTYALRYEVAALTALGNSLGDLVMSTAWSYAKSEIIKRTVFASLMAALWPLAFLKVGRVLDNPWRIAFVRSQKAGVVLADALCEGVQGARPVTLVGFSLGARVIFECCRELSRRRRFDVIESVVLMGAPVPSDERDWRCVRAVCSDRVVNCYSESDLVLAYLYRSASIQFGIAGLQKVAVAGVENCDLSDTVKGHLRYRFLVGRILRDRVGLEGLREDVILAQDAKLEELVEKERQTDERAAKERDTNDVVFDAADHH